MLSSGMLQVNMSSDQEDCDVEQLLSSWDREYQTVIRTRERSSLYIHEPGCISLSLSIAAWYQVAKI